MEVRKLLITFRLGSSCSALRLRCPMTTRPDGPTSTPPDRAPLCSTLLTSRSFLGTMARVTWQWHTSCSCICGPQPRHSSSAQRGHGLRRHASCGPVPPAPAAPQPRLDTSTPPDLPQWSTGDDPPRQQRFGPPPPRPSSRKKYLLCFVLTCANMLFF